MASRLLTVQEVADRYSVSVRSARRIMGEAGLTVILHKPYVREETLMRYENDRTKSTYYSRVEYGRRKAQ